MAGRFGIWHTSAFCHRWQDGRWHVGLEADSELFRLTKCISAWKEWGRNYNPSLSTRRALARLIESRVSTC